MTSPYKMLTTFSFSPSSIFSLLLSYNCVVEGYVTSSPNVSSNGVQGCLEVVDLAFLLDSSFNRFEIEPSWNEQIQFAMDVVSAFTVSPQASRVAALTIATTATVNFNLSRYSTVDQVNEHLSQLPRDSSASYVGAALDAANNLIFRPVYGDRTEVQNVAVLITDSSLDYNSNQTVPRATELKDRGTYIVVVYASSLETDIYQNVASGPEAFFQVETFDQLAAAAADVVQCICDAARDNNKQDVAGNDLIAIVVGVVVGVFIVIIIIVVVVIVIKRRTRPGTEKSNVAKAQRQPTYDEINENEMLSRTSGQVNTLSYQQLDRLANKNQPYEQLEQKEQTNGSLAGNDNQPSLETTAKTVYSRDLNDVMDTSGHNDGLDRSLDSTVTNVGV